MPLRVLLTVDDDSLIGVGTMVLNGARVGRGCLIAGAVVREGAEITGWLVAGVPAVVRRPVTDAERERMRSGNDLYHQLAAPPTPPPTPAPTRVTTGSRAGGSVSGSAHLEPGVARLASHPHVAVVLVDHDPPGDVQARARCPRRPASW